MSSAKDNPPVASPLASPASKEEDLTSVLALESKIVDDEMKSLRFGKKLMIEEVLTSLVERNTLNNDLVRLPKDEMVLKLEPDECVVFKDYFTAGLCFPIQDLLQEILDAYNIEMHHLMPDGISKIALFV